MVWLFFLFYHFIVNKYKIKRCIISFGKKNVHLSLVYNGVISIYNYIKHEKVIIHKKGVYIDMHGMYRMFCLFTREDIGEIENGSSGSLWQIGKRINVLHPP